MSAIITFGFVKPDMSKDPVLAVYGMVNACITYDYSPATEFMSVVWVFVCMLVILHIVTFVYRIQVYFGKDSVFTKAGYVMGFIFALMFSSMSISMVIHPSQSVEGHTISYQVLIVGTCFWWVFNAVIISHWPEYIPDERKLYWNVATTVFLLVSAFKIYLQWALMLLYRGHLDDKSKYVPPQPIPSFADPIWMVLFVFFRFHSPLSPFEIVINFSHLPTKAYEASSDEESVRSSEEELFP
eukprot:gnl/MRDRNA2_/MRDRNA2_255436_c0_seq1.p1 gnl/MRDRNA2_/MRDRNA2_255436_c0~~gnl/MRDRNA2_/MRDRNA2_255436_c0_seq1.p1  ORF type:complete len:278 (+),score=29.37 gnl/MRDRNA2_/MRDRNA2_255436_c0_seq1:113-835(+)